MYKLAFANKIVLNLVQSFQSCTAALYIDHNIVKTVTALFTPFPNRSYTVATGQKQKVKRIGGVSTVATPGYFLTCAACGKEMKKDEKTLKYIRNAEYEINYVHQKGCDEKYREKYAVK